MSGESDRTLIEFMANHDWREGIEPNILIRFCIASARQHQRNFHILLLLILALSLCLFAAVLQ